MNAGEIFAAEHALLARRSNLVAASRRRTRLGDRDGFGGEKVMVVLGAFFGRCRSSSSSDTDRTVLVVRRRKRKKVDVDATTKDTLSILSRRLALVDDFRLGVVAAFDGHHHET